MTDYDSNYGRPGTADKEYSRSNSAEIAARDALYAAMLPHVLNQSIRSEFRGQIYHREIEHFDLFGSLPDFQVYPGEFEYARYVGGHIVSYRRQIGEKEWQECRSNEVPSDLIWQKTRRKEYEALRASLVR